MFAVKCLGKTLTLALHESAVTMKTLRRKHFPFGVGVARKEYLIGVEKWDAAKV